MEWQLEESLYIFRLFKQEAVFMSKTRQEGADVCYSLCALHFVKGMILSLQSFAWKANHIVSLEQLPWNVSSFAGLSVILHAKLWAVVIHSVSGVP